MIYHSLLFQDLNIIRFIGIVACHYFADLITDKYQINDIFFSINDKNKQEKNIY